MKVKRALVEEEGLVVGGFTGIERGATEEEDPTAALDSPEYDFILPHVGGVGSRRV